MAAHSPLSARLAEEAGFEAIWASGFELSALNALPDASLLSLSDHLALVRGIASRCALPIVADADTGFGNAINVIHAVEAFEDAGASAIVIEDKSFPKMTSLIEGGRQQLVRVEEFVGKISAALHARRCRDFLVIARTEALIAGAGLEEALRRGNAYANAGADMILVHSRQKTPAEIESFIRAWDRATPIVVVPTAYPQLNDARARELRKIAMLIYGNHAIRASVRAMRDVFREIASTGSAETVGQRMASVDEIFALQEMQRLTELARRFLD